MSEHKINLNWKKGDAPFTYDAYTRNHQIIFKNDETVTFSAAAAYKGDASKGDPEDMLVAALSSCHMLSFLAIAAKKKLTVLSYDDEAVGYMEKDAHGKMAITRVQLRPRITWSGDRVPSPEELDNMHDAAHENCFIANSVKTQVTVASP